MYVGCVCSSIAVLFLSMHFYISVAPYISDVERIPYQQLQCLEHDDGYRVP